MKKSTILLVIVVYVLAFFVVGLLGISISSNHHVSYVNEILVSAVEDQPNLVEKEHKRTEISKEGVDEEYRRFENTYRFNSSYTPGLILKFRIKVMPDNTTYSGFTLDTKEDQYIDYDVKEGSLLYITFNRRGVTSFTVESTDSNKTQSTVTIYAL